MARETTTVVVNGRRLKYDYETPPWVPPPSPPVPPLEDGSIVLDPDSGPERCESLSGLSDQEKLDKLVRFAAAVWRNEVKNLPNQNKEWGAAFYFDSQNNLKSTSFVLSSDNRAVINWGDLPKLPQTGNPDYGRVVFVAHTHPQFNINPETGNLVNYFTPTDPFRLLRPSPDTMVNGRFQPGDWETSYNSVIESAEYQKEYEGGSGPNPNLSLVIIGFDGNDLAINHYKGSDLGYSSTVTGQNGVASDGLPGARGAADIQPLPPCSE